MSYSGGNGRLSVRSSDPYDIAPAIVSDPVPVGYDNGTILPAAYATVNQPYYLTSQPQNLTVVDTLAVGGEIDLNGGVLTVVGGVLELDGVPVGGGGGGAVDSVTAGNGLTVAPTTGNVVVAMPNVGTAGTTANVANIITDAQGRVTSKTSYGYVPQSAADVTAALAPYAPLAGATFTGPVDTTATTLTVAAPTANAQAASKLYVDNAVAGITPGGAVNTVVAGTNIAVDSTNAANPIVSVNVTSALNMQTNEINNTGNISAPIGAQLDIKGGEINLIQSATALDALPPITFPFTTVMNLNAVGGIGLTAGGGVGINAGGIVEIGAAGTVQITSLGNISIGSGNVAGADTEIEHVSFKDNVISKYTTIVPGPNPDLIIQDVDTITMSGDLTTTADVNAKDVFTSGDVVTQGFVQAPRFIVGDADAYTDLERAAGGYFTTQLMGIGAKGGVVDTLANPATLDLTGNTLSVKANNGAGTATTMGSVDLTSILPSGIYDFSSKSAAPGSTLALTAADANSAIFIDVTADGNVNVTLPNGVPNGTMFFIGLPYNTAAGSQLTVFPVGGGIGAGREIVIKAANGGVLLIANGTVAGNVMYIPTDTGAYLALTGGELTGALTMVGDSTVAVNAAHINTENIAALAPAAAININSLAQSRELYIRPEIGGSQSILTLAESITAPPAELATIKYGYALNDTVEINKRVEMPNATVGGADVLPLITFKDARTYFVSKQGADTNSGAANAPFLTVQAAVDACISSGVEGVIDVAPGVYSENLNIPSVAGLLIRGSLQNDRCTEGTSIQGLITVNVTGVDNLFNNQVVIAGCLIGGGIRDTSSKQHTLIVDGCRIEADSALGGEAVQVNMTATDGRTRITNCVMTQEAGTTGISPLVSINVGSMNMNQCELTVRAEGCCMTVSGSAVLTSMNLCALTSSSASATPNALLFLNSTTATTHNIGLSTFNYSVATSKTAPGILATRPSAGLITAVVAQCYFALAGTLAAGNVIQYGAGTALVLLVAENRSLNTAAAAYASRIQTGATVLPLSQVGETTVNTVNSLSGALTLAAGTNVTLGTVGNTITINSTASGGGVVNSVVGGTGIFVDSSTPSAPVVSNTGVLSVGVGAGLVNTGTASDPVIEIDGTGTITFQDVNATKLAASGTGSDYSTFGTYPRVGGTYSPPTEPSQLVPLQYVNDVDTGVMSVTAGDSSITIGGTSTAPSVAVSASGVTAASYTNTSLTVGSDGRITAASSGTAPVTSVTAGNGSITVGGTSTAPTVAVASSGVVAAAYTNASLTVGADGRITAASSGSAPVLSVGAGTGISVDNTIPSAPVVSNTGIVTASAGSGISIAASTPGNLNIENTGVLGLTAADSSVAVAGTSANPTVALPAQTLIPAAYTWPAITVNQKGVITAVAENSVPFTSISGTSGQIGVSGTPGSATIALATAGTGAATYAFPASVQVDTFGRVVAATAGTNPTGTFLPLAGGTMSGSINMGNQAITAASAITTTALTLNNLPLAIGTNGAGATASQNLYFTNANNSPVAIASYLFTIPTAGVSIPTYPAYNGENWVFPSGFLGSTFTINVNSTATTNVFSVPSGFYIHLWNRKASTVTVTIASVANPLLPAGAVNTPVTLTAGQERFIQYQGVANTWAII